MHPIYAFAVASTILFAALPVQAGLYTKGSPVVQVSSKNYDRLIAKSNYTSIVEFYAPWCGHCKNLQPAYEKAAKSLAGLAKVAAVDCDEESNKAFCGGMGVQGFPTLKIVKPGKKLGKPVVEDYNGPRTAKGIVEMVVDKIPNHVTKVEDKTLEAWLAEANETAKVVLFTDKGRTSALIKAVAIDFKGSLSVAQIRDNQKASLELFGVSKFPTLLLLPGGKEAQGTVYNGEFNKAAIVDFISKITSIDPNPDPAPPKAKISKPKEDGKKKKAFESASSSHAKEEGKTAAGTATDEILEEEATESPGPRVDTQKPVVLPDPAPAIPLISSDELSKQCLSSRSGTCVLALLPRTLDDISTKALNSLAEVTHRYKTAKRSIFPFFNLPEELAAGLKQQLKIEGPSIIAINTKRGWWRALPFEGDKPADVDVTIEAIEQWVDAIRMGEGAKEKIPAGLILEEAEEEPAVTQDEVKAEPSDDVHDEL